MFSLLLQTSYPDFEVFTIWFKGRNVMKYSVDGTKRNVVVLSPFPQYAPKLPREFYEEQDSFVLKYWKGLKWDGINLTRPKTVWAIAPILPQGKLFICTILSETQNNVHWVIIWGKWHPETKPNYKFSGFPEIQENIKTTDIVEHSFFTHSSNKGQSFQFD